MIRKIEDLGASIYQEIFPRDPSKSQRRKLEIIEATIECLSKEGIESVNFHTIAKTCNVTRTLICHYFTSMDELLEITFRYIRAILQDFAIQEMKKATDPKSMLISYVKSVFSWMRKHPHHAKVWIYFYYKASISKKLKNEHSKLVEMGFNRIKELISLGQKVGVFQIRNLDLQAKIIQSHITGSGLTLMTETSSIDPKDFEEEIVRLCLREVGVN